MASANPMLARAGLHRCAQHVHLAFLEPLLIQLAPLQRRRCRSSLSRRRRCATRSPATTDPVNPSSFAAPLCPATPLHSSHCNVVSDNT